VTKFVLEEIIGDDKGSGTVTLWPIRFHCVEI